MGTRQRVGVAMLRLASSQEKSGLDDTVRIRGKNCSSSSPPADFRNGDKIHRSSSAGIWYCSRWIIEIVRWSSVVVVYAARRGGRNKRFVFFFTTFTTCYRNTKSVCCIVIWGAGSIRLVILRRNRLKYLCKYMSGRVSATPIDLSVRWDKLCYGTAVLLICET